MQSIYFTALICYLPLRQNPPKTNQQQKTKKNKNKPQSDPPSSLPDPNTFLKYLSAHSKHLFCFLAEAGDINHTGGEGGKEGGRWSSRRGGGFFFFKNASMPTLYVHEASPPHLTRWKQILKTNKSEASWHGLNDCIVKMIFGLLTDGVTTRTHRLPHKLIYT